MTAAGYAIGVTLFGAALGVSLGVIAAGIGAACAFILERRS